jgi:predicted metal-dependent peptidase
MARTFRPTDSDPEVLDRKIIKSEIFQTPFWAEISRRTRKIATDDIPTAAITFESSDDELVMYYNPKFLDGLSDNELVGVVKHEFYHAIFGHLTTRRKFPPVAWNISTDLAINSVILDKNATSNEKNHLPSCVLVPGKLPTPPKDRKATKTENGATKFAKHIEKMPTLEASEYYYGSILGFWQKEEFCSKCGNPMSGPPGKITQKSSGSGSQSQSESDPSNSQSDGKDGTQGDNGNDPSDKPEGQKDKGQKGKGEKGSSPGENPSDNGSDGEGENGDENDPNHTHGQGNPCDHEEDCDEGHTGDDPYGLKDVGIETLDNHDVWDNIPDEKRDAIEAKINSIVAAAVAAADQSSDGWGSIPASVRDEIRRSVSNQIDWRMVLRQFVGNLNPAGRTTSIKRINRRFPYIHPGMKRARVAKLLIAIDQSGSVGDEMLVQFFAELATLTKKVNISILPFDCAADVKDVYEWKRGQKLNPRRDKMGGTDFDAPTNVFNDPVNRGMWDGLLIMTDGIAPAPGACRGRRGWVLGSGCKLNFESSELQICVDKNKILKGAWR